MYQKLINSNVPYDVLIPSDYMIERLIKEDRLKEIDMQKTVQRKNRGQLVRVALVGYTNAGKSTLLNMMEKHFTYDEMDKITHLNALRVMKDVLGK